MDPPLFILPQQCYVSLEVEGKALGARGTGQEEILEEAVEPFVDDLKRQIDLGLETEALELCQGLVLGLYRVAHGKGAALVEWAPDFPAEAAARAIETWGTGGQSRKASERGARRPRPPFPQAFIDRCVPDWRDMVSRILSRKRKP